MAQNKRCSSGEIFIRGLGCRPKNRIQQINNITIFYDDFYKFGCKFPDGRIMEDRMTYVQAREWATMTKDCIRRRK